MRQFLRDVLKAINDPERDLRERVFLIYTLTSELSVFGALLSDLIFGENVLESIVLATVLVAVPLLTYICFYNNCLNRAMRIIVTSLVFLILPTVFFFGGGTGGGGIFWFIFTFLYAGHVLTGGWRRTMMGLIALETALFYAAEYYHPEWIVAHSGFHAMIDSLISLLLVGGVCYSMTNAQNRLFEAENLRAKVEAMRAEELTRAQNRFFSSMSHEIRTPINSILGLNELILRDTSDPDEIARNASGIRGAGKMLLALINDILDFSKMEAGSMEIVPVDYKLGDMLSEVVNMIWLRATDKGLKFEVSVDPSVPSGLYGDEVRIKQVVVNLLNNAVKYTQKGSVGLHIESNKIDDDSVMLQISITDTGMGIKKDAIPFLFDAFKRVDEEKNRHIEGTGLGLSIVKQIVDLMEGTVTVNSVYGEGSTFTVTVKQGISDAGAIGQLNIHNQQKADKSSYESSFKAPSARILIVDDNELNLEVETKLLAATEMTIDQAASGREALEMTVVHHYDVILMDHLMPEMDGIKCLEYIRNQVGGLNRTSPVIVLTANAGSDNKDLYNRSGFDGYLVKPVSGESLENTLMRFISPEKLIVTGRIMRMREDINTLEGYAGKTPVVITSTSMCDLPDSLIKKLRLPILPFLIHTDQTVFKDGVQMGADELITYLKAGKKVVSSPPSDREYTEFFAQNLKKAHHLIHIAITTGMSDDYRIASEAARAFENVTVINSGCVSSATGLLVLIAYKLAQQNTPVEGIVEELEDVKRRLKCSFIIETTEYMAKKGLIGDRIDRVARYINLHPSLSIRKDKTTIGGAWLGDVKRSYKKYIRRTILGQAYPDPDVAFITYANIPAETLLWIRDEVNRLVQFENIIFVQASAAISSNCGPGSFGILFFTKGSKSYNLSSFIDQGKQVETEDGEDEAEDYQEIASFDDSLTEVSGEEGAGAVPDVAEEKWYHQIPNLDGDIAVANSGSEELLRTVLKIFYESMAGKQEEIRGYYDSENWENYAIKVHALKSSAKIIGALKLAEDAQKLEDAGKAADVDYIRSHHDAFLADYDSYREPLSRLFPPEEDQAESKPVADDFLVEAVYAELVEAADAMDFERIEAAMKEMDDYAIPAAEQERYAKVRELADALDYEGIAELLKG